mmetsp:Transcript_9465/g.14583  ORF Transcript_9465/g.14583 Transcript_9465/m.14583 type:complete len:161 (-) Transcript_9465:140-622(-)
MGVVCSTLQIWMLIHLEMAWRRSFSGNGTDQDQVPTNLQGKHLRIMYIKLLFEKVKRIMVGKVKASQGLPKKVKAIEKVKQIMVIKAKESQGLPNKVKGCLLSDLSEETIDSYVGPDLLDFIQALVGDEQQGSGGKEQGGRGGLAVGLGPGGSFEGRVCR